MKKELQKLLDVSKAYVEWGKKVKLPLSHTELRVLDGKSYYHGGKYQEVIGKGKRISVYFNSDYTVSNVEFRGEGTNAKGNYRDFCVTDYTQSFEIPFDTDAAEISKIADDAADYLITHLKPMADQWRDISNNVNAESKQKEIALLEEKLAKLKGDA